MPSTVNPKHGRNPTPDIRVRYRNPVAAFMTGLASLAYWMVYWLAYFIIYLSGTVILLGLVWPRHAWRVLNSMLKQDHMERHFKDEL